MQIQAKHLYTAGYKSNKAIKSAADEEELEAGKAAARRERYGPDDTP